MRKLTLLKKIGIGLAPVAIATPLIFTTTSCSKTNSILTTYISYDKILNDQSLDHMSKGNFDNDDLLLGSKKFFGGNYIMLIGSNAYPIDDKTGLPSNTSLFFGDSFNSRSVEE
ncbi:MAG: hypothetical protein MJ195_00495 [Mycoplasmoidaceae bacterium]|nr:hypothetical protein [Mycoplasmoidaceae bacterium]